MKLKKLLLLYLLVRKETHHYKIPYSAQYFKLLTIKNIYNKHIIYIICFGVKLHCIQYSPYQEC